MAAKAWREGYVWLSVGERVALQRDAGGIERGRGQLDFSFAVDLRRLQAYDIVSGLLAQLLPRAQRLDQLLVRQLAFQPKHQPLPAYLLDDLAVLVLQRGKALSQP
jgi:hypothetical protein